MKLTSIAAIYFLFWAFSFFLVLPFRLRSADAEDPYIRGQAESAPPHFSVKRTATWTTLVAAVLFGLFYLNYVYGWVGAGFFDLITPKPPA